MPETPIVTKWTVIFLIDGNPASKVILLKRASNKSFAPSLFTGIGGKVGDKPEFANETVLASAYRELEEETQGDLNNHNIELTEFARCIYNSGLCLYYFWGTYTKLAPPHFDPADGELFWVDKDQLLTRDFIPTTGLVCKEWHTRGLHVTQPFSVYVKEVGQAGSVRLVEPVKVVDGLDEPPH